MTDVRFPERWLMDRRFHRLTDGGFRAFMTSLAWSVSNRTDGVIQLDDLPLIPRFGDHANELVQAGLWAPLDGTSGWLIVDFAVTQTSADDLARLEHVRAADRLKKAKQRARAKESLGTVPGDVSPGTSQDRTELGQAGQAGITKQGFEPRWQVAEVPVDVGTGVVSEGWVDPDEPF